MSKYYAVRIGRTPGIYRSWTDCKPQVHGYSGAVYKSFKTINEAKRFCGTVPAVPTSPVLALDSKLVEIFTDGSHFKGGSVMGYGILFRHAGREYGLSQNPVTPFQLSAMFGGDFSKVSNPTMEFAAIAHALRICNCIFPEVTTIDITYDYIGSKNWLLELWTCRKPYIKQIYEFAKTDLDKLSSRGAWINWIHVKSHTGHRENEMADMLAKGIWPKGLEHIRERCLQNQGL